MVDHEYPYLERPEILEYPTETWAAQDMRKSEVFRMAALHTRSDDERRRFLERAEHFFASCVSQLETHAVARLHETDRHPVVVRVHARGIRGGPAAAAAPGGVEGRIWRP